MMGKPKQLWEFTSDKHQSKINEKIDYYVGMLVELGIDPDDDLQEFLMALERDHRVTIQTRGLSKDINALEDAVHKPIIHGKDPYDLLSELRDIVENAENLTPPWRGYNLSPRGSGKHKLTDDIKKG